MATDTRLTEGVELIDGARMSRREFHAAYERMPSRFRAELLAGRVYVASPMKIAHGENTPPLTTLFTLYEARTPGVVTAEGASVFLSDDDEPQPDLMLR